MVNAYDVCDPEMGLLLTSDTTELDIEFHEEKILKMLDKLNVSKSPRPDELHPRILYETRTKITTPLKLIFEASLELKELPHDWVKGAVQRKTFMV